jgi:aspartate/methionine/tyrosine aminotransferase
VNIKTPFSVGIADLVEEVERKGETIAKLHNGEPFFNAPVSAEDITRDFESLEVRYCDSKGLLSLRKALVDHYQNSFSINDIIVTHGAVGAIKLSLEAVLSQGDEVVVIEPAWCQYANQSEGLGAKVVRAKVDEVTGKITAKTLSSYFSKNTKVVIINNPVNPTGIVYTEDEIAQLLKLSEAGIYFLFDEVYNKYIYSFSFTPLVLQEGFQKYRDLIIYVNSFSKAYAMTGYRLGYCVLPQNLQSKILAISQNSLTCISPLLQSIGKGVLINSNSFDAEFREYLSILERRKNELEQVFVSRGIPFIRPEGAFYFFFKTKSNADKTVEDILNNFRISLVPGSGYGKGFEDYIRICYSTSEYSYSKFRDLLENYDFY